MTNYLAKYALGLGFAKEGVSPAERADQYYRALGEFLSTFALLESAMHRTLWHYAGLKYPIAQALCSGFKIDQETSLIKRIAEARHLSKDVLDDLTEIFQHLGQINSARNDILHYGAHPVEEGEATVSNWIFAIGPSRLREFRISPEHLNDMRHDCMKIIVLLHTRHLGRRNKIKAPKAVRHFLKEPWRYKHALKGAQKSPKHAGPETRS